MANEFSRPRNDRKYKCYTELKLCFARFKLRHQGDGPPASAKTRRCLIPADGWYEWKAEPDLPRRNPRGRGSARAGTRKQPYYFHRRDGEPLFLAALWTADTYCLLTAPPTATSPKSTTAAP